MRPRNAIRRFARGLVLIAAVAAHPIVTAQGAAALDDRAAAGFIERLGTEAIGALQQQSQSQVQREAAFAGILRKGFALDLIGRFALGRHWRQATPAQQSDYLTVFRHFVIKTYARRLRDFSARGFAVTGTAAAGAEGDIIVLTRIERTGAAALLAGWRVREIEGQPRIVDVVVEGVSMTITQRQEFASVTRRGGIDELLRSLRLQTARLSASAG